MRRTLVIGDIHGCYDELMSLLNKAGLGTDDQVVAVGDLIVKGRKNKEVLDLFISDGRFSSVIGNHDLAILNFWQGRRASLKSSQKRACEELEMDKQRYADYLCSLPFLIDLGTYAVVHAGVRPGIALSQQSPEDLVEIRTLGADRASREGTPWYEVYDGEKVIIFGHWPGPTPKVFEHAIGLDTGCVYGHQLTGYILETGEFLSVNAREVYDAPGTRFRGAPQ